MINLKRLIVEGVEKRWPYQKDVDIIKAKIAIKFCKLKKWNYRLFVGKNLELNEGLSYDHTS